MGKSQREFLERFVAGVEHDHAHTVGVDVEALLADLESEDEAVRLRALQQACPCHVPWEVFAQVRKAANRLRRDPSERVRAVALHLERDAQDVLSAQGALETARERDDEVAEAQRRRGRPRVRP